MAGVIQALGTVFPFHVQKPEAGPVSLFRVLFAVQQQLDKFERIRPDFLCPVLKPTGCPLLLFLMPGWHMFRPGGEATAVILSYMAGDRFTFVEYLDRVVTSPDFHLFFYGSSGISVGKLSNF